MMNFKVTLPFIAVGMVLLGCNGSSFKGKGNSAESGLTNAVDSATSGANPINDQDYLANGPNSILDSTTLSAGIDIVIALDTSGSMSEEKVAIENNLNKMMLALQNSKLDPRIHLIAGLEQDDDDPPATGPIFRFPPDIDPAKVALVAQPVDSNDALSHISKLLSGLYNNLYKDVKEAPMAKPMAFRPGAKLEVLVISDDNGENDPAVPSPPFSNLAKDFDSMNKWKATVSGIIGLPTSVQVAGVCGIAAIGQEYITLATKTGGSLLDICSNDWSAMIQRFSQDVVKRSASILLTKVPADPAAIVVFLDGKKLPSTAWTYDSQENRVLLVPGTPYNADMVLKVNYTAK